jgi:hypothetical protein
VSTFVHWKTAWLVDCALDVSIDWAGRVQKSKHNTSRNKDRPVVSTGTNFQRDVIDYIYHAPRTLDKIERLPEVCGSRMLKIQVFWDVTPCRLVGDFPRFGGS